jgi:transcriptional antiterminator RfaH
MMLLTETLSDTEQSTENQWYCVQTRPKQEHIAEATLRQNPEIEVYSPFLRIQRVTPRGKVWFKEALFPCYVFACFDPVLHSRNVSYASGVARILRFGDNLATVPSEMIQVIKTEMGGSTVREVFVNPHVGDDGELAHGPLKGFEGVIRAVYSGRERAKILIEFLGGLHEVEVPIFSLKTPRHAREFVSQKSSD